MSRNFSLISTHKIIFTTLVKSLWTFRSKTQYLMTTQARVAVDPLISSAVGDYAFLFKYISV